MPQVLNARGRRGIGDWQTQVYVGRPTKWGNPYLIGQDGTREEVVSKYRSYILNSHLMDELYQLRDMDLVCWCAPLPCHADVLLDLANGWA